MINGTPQAIERGSFQVRAGSTAVTPFRSVIIMIHNTWVSAISG